MALETNERLLNVALDGLMIASFIYSIYKAWTKSTGAKLDEDELEEEEKKRKFDLAKMMESSIRWMSIIHPG